MPVRVSLTTPCRAICSGRLSRPHRLRPAANRRSPATISATMNSVPMPPQARAPGHGGGGSSEAPAANDSEEASSDEPAWAHHSRRPAAAHTDAAPLRGAKRPIPNGCCSTAWATSSSASSKTPSNSPGAGAHPHRQGGRQGDRTGADGGHPHHAAERYCAELIKQGYSVAFAINSKPPHQGCPAQAGHHPGADPRHRVGRGCSAPAATTGWQRWWWTGPQATTALGPGQRR